MPNCKDISWTTSGKHSGNILYNQLGCVLMAQTDCVYAEVVIFRFSPVFTGVEFMVIFLF